MTWIIWVQKTPTSLKGSPTISKTDNPNTNDNKYKNMKTSKYLPLLILVLAPTYGFAQREPAASPKDYPTRELTIEPGIGIHTNFGTDLLLAGLIQWNPYKRLSLASHTSFNINNLLQRDFNYIKTDYNYSFNQKFGAGTTFYSRKSTHTLLLMIGAKYTAFKETVYNPAVDKVSASISALSPDYGLMYSHKRGLKKYFFTGRLYVPLYPWPVKGSDINFVDGNINNIALEVGVGMKVK
ncbi:MAG: hypothetical protein RIB71_14505 [Imperialibacter sp.]|jgi:hypothetical protein|uniref:hypothetical protein n=1 Tax=Imperialibacter sp. TaxID=2038411 RepID=UPI0032EC0FF2